MEFHEKLQELRRQKGLTQEQLAQELYVSRTAVSKWESGRGYPNIDSLQAIARFFGLTVDELLSGGALRAGTGKRCTDLVSGLLDAAVILLLFLPVFGQKTGAVVASVSLLALTGAAPYMRGAYLALIAAAAAMGLLTLALQGCTADLWNRAKRPASLALSAAGTLLFIMGGQSYAATIMLALLAVKVFLFVKKR